MDNWRNRRTDRRCDNCISFVPKIKEGKNTYTIGRCRRHSPTHDGYPVVFFTDWCGDHKYDEEKI